MFLRTKNNKISFLLYLSLLRLSDGQIRPHIIFIMADDLGFNDVGFHGSSEIPTPNIDALAYSGIILNNYYVNPICTPSRSALMTGKHPIHTGMQHTVLFGAEPRGLSLNETILPQYLKKLGYTNRIVGKWHLGSWKLKYTPTYRGFDSHLGFWTGHHDYNDHTAMESPGWGLDMRRNEEVAWDLHGKYSTDVFTKEAVRLISTHNTTKPLFLYLAHAAVHSGNPYNPLAAPDELVGKFSHIENYNRRRFAGVLSKLDESVGLVVSALQKADMLSNSIIVFSSDNGGPAEGFNLNAASNWPLRGVKNTLWEGGVRGAGLLWSPLLYQPKRISTQMMHITDWLPTLYTAAGGKISDLGNIDGYNLWDALSKDERSARNDILHNIDDIYGNAALTLGPWKIIKGSTYNGVWDSWYGPSGRNGSYDIKKITSSYTGEALSKINKCATPQEILELREHAKVNCSQSIRDKIPCNPFKKTCLFNIEEDPCEEYNLASIYPEIIDELEMNLKQWNATAVPPANLPLDPKGNPKYWEYTWTNFGDYPSELSVQLT